MKNFGTAEVVVPAEAELGEGPVWDPVNGRLLWVDILAGHVHATSPEGDDRVIWHADSTIGCIAHLAGDRWVVAERDRLTLVTNWSVREELVVLDVDDDVRTNDGKLDPNGRMIVGTMQMDAEPDRGQLFSWDGDTLRVLVEPVTISNGLGWSADGSSMYYIDTPTQEIASYGYDTQTGELGPRQVLAHVEPSDGSPDGMCVGPDGDLWVALWGGRAVRRYSPAGKHLGDIAVDAQNVSCCAWGDNTLWITSARVESPGGPYDGAIFRSS